MAEWFKAHAWKACKGATLSWVRIPFSPPSIKLDFKDLFDVYYLIIYDYLFDKINIQK